jgi:hypothetical protein
MSQFDSSTSPAQERQRLERICAVLVEAFEAHPETRDADRCAISVDNQRGVVVDDYDDPGEMWTARRVVAHYEVGVRFSMRTPTISGAIRLGAGTRPCLRFDPAVVRERWASVHALPAEARTRRCRPTTKLHAVRTVDLPEYESDD